MEMKKFIDFAKNQGINLKKRWISEGFVWRYFEGRYKGLRFICSKVMDGELHWGIKVKFFYSRPNNLGFCCKCKINPPITALYYKEHRDIFSRKVDTGIEGLRCFAVRKDPIEILFRQESVVQSINALKDILQISDTSPIHTNALLINDEFVVAFIRRGASVNLKHLMDTIYDLCTSLWDFWKNQDPGIYKTRPSEKIFRVVSIFLIIVLLFVCGWTIFSAYP